MDEVCVVIPAYEPGSNLIDLCEDMYSNHFDNVFIVDDGSGEEYQDIFNEIRNRFGYNIFKHVVNLGKGRALKDAFNIVLNEQPNCLGCVTADSDGQHTVEDIQKCIDAMHSNPNSLVIGCRQFDGDDIPWKSKFGNKMTRIVFSYLCGIKVSDTQTGLRGIPKDFMRRCCTIKGERFEYETNMFIEWGGAIIEIPIATIYDSKLEHKTHFDPIADSMRIYKTIIIYGFSSLLSTIIDFIVFSLCVWGGFSVWTSTAISRSCAAILNFLVNKKAVFKSKGNTLVQLIKYLLLVIVSGTISATLINYISDTLSINVVVLKVFVELLLFFFNYYVQRAYIFVKKKGE